MRRGSPRLFTSLFLLLLLAGGIPLLLILIVGWIPLRQQMRLWTLPSVELALDSSLRANREAFFSLHRSLERRARARASDVAGTELEASRDALETALQAIVEAERVDLAQLWVRDAGGLVLLASVASTGKAETSGEFASPLPDRTRVGPQRPAWIELHGAETDWIGVPAFIWPEDRTETHPRAALVLGFALGKGYFERVGRGTAGLSYYRRLGEVSDMLRTSYLLLFSLAAVTAVAISLWLARRVARGVSLPVEQLVIAMEALGRGEFRPLEIQSRFPEIVTLAGAFHQLGSTLRDYEERIRESEQVRGARETARFVAHEIRNSLTPVRAAVGVLERRVAELPEAERERGRRALELIQTEAERMTRLASTFSDYAHLPEPRPEPIDPGEVLRQLLALEVPDRITHQLLEPEAPLTVRADRDELVRAFRNLIKNAVEAIPGAGSITAEVRLSDTGNEAIISISDSGTGMDTEMLRQATQPGFTTKQTGTGLGLALVRRTVSRYGGRLRLESEPGRGTRVVVSLPYDLNKGKDSNRRPNEVKSR
ncbi:MAG: HAMP domain-containing histidine kinase [Candidatus Eisenbacteria bacterium]|nr:HAMP domain-containing histidine kinase [Candidatus Eisenbacteria bacterium]MCC7143615.1 HAMP domain-containing histidine kinase [Candidatus Eisenbacteria bacterium]